MVYPNPFKLGRFTGFTLVELLIVIAVIAIVATISVPFYLASSQNIQLNAAARDLASDLRYAQQMAVSTQNNYSLVFNQSANSYQIIIAATRAVQKSQKIKSPIYIYAITDLPANTVTFNATGAATSSGSIILSAVGGRQAVIEIKPSGYVQID